MKRGLKGTWTVSSSLVSKCCSNHCPDEKGTESSQFVTRVNYYLSVATIAAMKSGLKACHLLHLSSVSILGSNHCRDEKRTESIYQVMYSTNSAGSSNHCRDEKRTERLIPRFELVRNLGSNHCRDEKRTERA